MIAPDILIYTVVHPQESCQIYVEDGKIKGYKKIDYDGRSHLTLERLKKVNTPMEAELKKEEAILNWRYHAQGID